METKIKNSSLEAVIKHQGAELFSLKKDGKNLLWDIDTRFWNKTSPVLFPIVGALKDDSFFYQGEKYPLTIHGFARDMEFKIKEQKEDFVSFFIESNEETKKKFPFDFILEISYLLKDDSLCITYTITNPSSGELWYSIGAHPAFALDGKLDEFSLEFDPQENVTSYQLDNRIVSGRTFDIPLKNNRFDLNIELFDYDTLVFKNYTTSQVTLWKEDLKVVKIEFPDFPFLGIWTKKDAPYICIEPWLGVADHADHNQELTEKEGIRKLESRQSESFTFSITGY